ncbi:MAG: rhodanese-like domain-containing protein [Candidatus Altiarchaeota archaeon]|nr:rhodanese-like domain-containing protein [Candidatus Altiarchaeota archaeon]
MDDRIRLVLTALLVVLSALILASGYFYVSVISPVYSSQSIKMDKLTFSKYYLLGSGFDSLSIEELKELMDSESDPLVIDLRLKEQYSRSHIPGSVSVSFNSIVNGSTGIVSGGDVVFVCSRGKLSRVAAAVLADRGVSQVYSLDGGFSAWKYEVEENIL